MTPHRTTYARVIGQKEGASPSDRAVAASPSSPTVSPVPASIPDAVAIMTELGGLWYKYVCQDHHKDRDCHFAIEASFSYGEWPTYRSEHNGYVDEFPRDKRDGFSRPKFATFDLALWNCIDETLAMFRRHYKDLPDSIVERLTELAAQAIEARSGETGTGSTVGESPVPAGDAPHA